MPHDDSDFLRHNQMFREKQPPTLIVWGENDQFFTKEGALAYGTDLQNIEYNFFPSGHFVLEEFYIEIAAKIDDFLQRKMINDTYLHNAVNIAY